MTDSTAEKAAEPGAAGNSSSAVPVIDFSRSWRYKTGIGLFTFGQIVFFVGLLLPVLGLASAGNAGFVGMLILGGEVITISSVVFLGKAGFQAIKEKLFGFLKEGFETPVGPVRHYLGLSILFMNMLTTYATAIYAWTAFSASTPDAPIAPMVWGLDLNEQASLVLWLFVLGQLCFLVAIYVLGADWWERLRNLVVYQQTHRAADA